MGFAVFYFFIASSLNVTRVTSDVRCEVLYLFLCFACSSSFSSFMTYSFSFLDFLAVFNFLSFVLVSFKAMFFFSVQQKNRSLKHEVQSLIYKTYKTRQAMLCKRSSETVLFAYNRPAFRPFLCHKHLFLLRVFSF